ncbi:MAG: hypothetical protein O4751_01640, partial [Trichodesmium sp. St2_bin6]|nr:hypothetical protein [Trichodesmium sp. St2_bin6]
LSEVSRQNFYYQSLKANPLFDQKIDSSKYELNYEQAEYVREYLNKIVTSNKQKFKEPFLRGL